MTRKKLKSYLALTIAILTVFVIAIIGLNASSANDKDVEAIKNILIKSETIADKAYIDARELERTEAIGEQTKKTETQKEQDQKEKEAKKDGLIKSHTNEFNNVFSEKANKKDKQSGKTMKEKWVDTQFTNVADGTDCIDCGVSNIEIKDISINDNTATVTAVLTKYLIDRVNQDGKLYHDKMQGEVLVKATLTKTDNKWLIDEFSSDPQYGDVKHTLTEQK